MRPWHRAPMLALTLATLVSAGIGIHQARDVDPFYAGPAGGLLGAHVRAGELFTIGLPPWEPRIRRDVVLEDVHLVHPPAGATVAYTAFDFVDTQTGIGGYLGPLGERFDRPHPVRGLRLPKGERASFLVASITFTRPGTYRLRDVDVTYEVGGRTGHERLRGSWDVDVCPSTDPSESCSP